MNSIVLGITAVFVVVVVFLFLSAISAFLSVLGSEVIFSITGKRFGISENVITTTVGALTAVFVLLIFYVIGELLSVFL